MADAGLGDLDAGLGQPLLDLVAEVVGDVGGVAAQRVSLVVLRVVGVAGGEAAEGGLALDVDELLVVVDLEQRLRGIDHPPHDDRGDLDGIAVEVVHLEALALEVAHPQRDGPLAVEGAGPAQAGLLGGPDVPAEQLQHLGLVGVDHEHPCDEDEVRDQRHDAPDNESDVLGLDAGDEPGNDAGHHEQEGKQDEASGDGRDLAFLQHASNMISL